MQYLSVEEAMTLPGLRVAFTRGVPGPWSEAAKALLQIKRIPFAAVAQEGGGSNQALQAWTGQNSAPVAMLDDERPRSHWSEILMLAERLAPEPQMIPSDEDDRACLFGMIHELCGEDGFGWNCRLLMLGALGGQAAETASVVAMRRKFSSGVTTADHSRRRIVAVMTMLSRRLARQQAAGRRYLVGNSLSAADIYWTAFSNLIAPMAEVDCPMPDFYRTASAGEDPEIRDRIPPLVIDHRERILHEHFTLPMAF